MQGSIQPRTGKNGTKTWTVVVDLPRGADGKRKQTRLSAPTRKALEAKLAETLNAINRGVYVKSTDATVGEYLPTWLEATAPTIKPATYARNERYMRLHVLPELGAVPLAQLSALHIQTLYRRKLDAGLAPGTVATGLHALIHKALKQAVRWQMIPRNVAEGVTVPRPERTPLKTWTADQARSFLDAADDRRFAAMWRLALLTGMRVGELLALRWEDLDLDRAALAVRRTVTVGRDKRPTFGPPKTAASKRAIAIPPSCVAALRAHKVAQLERRVALGPEWRDLGLVFDRGNGEMMHPATHRHVFRAAVKRAGLPEITFHGLRHTNATLDLARKTHPKIVQERLGHARIGMTLDLYSHVTMDMQREAADGLDDELTA